MHHVIRVGVFFILSLMMTSVSAESKQEYQNRFRLMLDFAVRTNEYVRNRLGDRGLAAYAHAMAKTNSDEAEQITPPPQYQLLHPHFLLVLSNVERSFYFVSQGKMKQYRHHQKILRTELRLLEALAEQEQLDLYLWMRCI